VYPSEIMLKLHKENNSLATLNVSKELLSKKEIFSYLGVDSVQQVLQDYGEAV
jgi:hypothetical protein